MVLRRLLLLPGGGTARAASVPTASGTFDVRLQRFASSLSRDVFFRFGSVRTQNASSDWVIRWSTILIPKNTVDDLFCVWGASLETVLVTVHSISFFF